VLLALLCLVEPHLICDELNFSIMALNANTWTDKEGQTQYDHWFVITGFRFGAPGHATRETFDTSVETHD
jgi:hypothetical protein